MLKNQVVIEVKRGDNIHRYYIPDLCQAGEVCDVLFEMRGLVMAKIQESQDANKPKEPEAPTQEVVSG